MKRFIFNNLIISVLLISLFIGHASFSQSARDCTNDRKVKKDAKRRWKQKSKQGWEADVTYGDGRSQYANYICKYQNSDDYYVETYEGGVSKNRSLASQKAREIARNELGKNMGGFFNGLIQSGNNFVNGSGEDLTDEIQESTAAFDEVFAQELKRNQMAMRFYKRERGGLVSCEVTIVMNKKAFEDDIKKLKKKELRNRIDKVRKKIRDR